MTAVSQKKYDVLLDSGTRKRFVAGYFRGAKKKFIKLFLLVEFYTKHFLRILPNKKRLFTKFSQVSSSLRTVTITGLRQSPGQ